MDTISIKFFHRKLISTYLITSQDNDQPIISLSAEYQGTRNLPKATRPLVIKTVNHMS